MLSLWTRPAETGSGVKSDLRRRSSGASEDPLHTRRRGLLFFVGGSVFRKCHFLSLDNALGSSTAAT